ncbi:non-homologous end-joining factor 1 [Phyllopteryx taeniolatus]|uniref:non-homologous end-joining factor 1 n=1 Tax=Phyllopteryx taeniolatus TaxID=161469 RepID=UPI002AD2B668|nr:non-homologous end-joining factor 1 [Phyllopteryx taeniolatus]XP_061635345.1 non-homologous end-joining factor 1 [Phyllopteryx taeniolatus]XP_061635354.1 non-homologous end-joining factor 1 [Phyllopteryx taeniolatus]
MEATGASTDVLLQKPWLPVSIDGCQLLAKSCFGDTRYQILLTDLHCVWEETLHSTAIQSRAQELNKRLQAPVKAFFSHLCELVQPCLSGSSRLPKDEAGISVMQLDGGDLSLRLKSKLLGLPFYWEFRCTPAPITVVCLHLVQPLLSMSHVLNRQVEQLEGLLARKDAEIQDYKENGATLSRARLQTDIFERHIYKGSFLAKTLPVVCCDPHGIWDFGGDLQELYTAIVSHGIMRKRKLSEQDQLVATGPDPTASSAAEAGAEGGEADSEPNHTSPMEEAGDHMVHTATAPQLVTCGRAERVSSKAKKKKVVGLFR